MSATHTHAERFSLSEHAAEQRRIHRARLAQLRSERAANCVSEAASSSEDPSDDTDENKVITRIWISIVITSCNQCLHGRDELYLEQQEYVE